MRVLVLVIMIVVVGSVRRRCLVLLIVRIVVRPILVVIAGSECVPPIVADGNIAHQLTQQAEEAGLCLDCPLTRLGKGVLIIVMFSGANAGMRELVVGVGVHFFIKLAVS